MDSGNRRKSNLVVGCENYVYGVPSGTVIQMLKHKHCGTQECQRGYDRPSAWIESMRKKELLHSKALDCNGVSSSSDHIKNLLTMKWFIQKKHDSEKTVIRNKFSSGIFTTKNDHCVQMDVKTAFLHGSLKKRRVLNQSPCGIFINQSNYVLEILKKYGMETCDPVGTPMEIKDKLDLDQNGSPVMQQKFAKPTKKHLKEDSGIELTGFSDADYAGCKDTFKSTSGGAQFLGKKLD
ncbi:hypothetical protein Tco_1292560 [Tanacetum coccineum]